jgi:hypothetical protein
MDVMHPRCCGLDVHKKTIVACVLTQAPWADRSSKSVRSGR